MVDHSSYRNHSSSASSTTSTCSMVMMDGGVSTTTTTTSTSHHPNLTEMMIMEDHSNSNTLRYDEQACEAHFDERSDAGDDLLKGKLKFNKNKLFGRDKELAVLNECFQQTLDGSGEGSNKNSPKNSATAATKKTSAGGGHSPTNNTGKNPTSSSSAVATSSIAFVSGYSGVGKSSLVREFIARKRREYSNGKKRRTIISSFGKYNEHISGDPFSAISESVRQMINSVWSGGVGGSMMNDTDEEEFSDEDEGQDDETNASPIPSVEEEKKRQWKELEQQLSQAFSQQEKELLLELSPSFTLLFQGRTLSRTGHINNTNNNSMAADPTESTKDDDELTELIMGAGGGIDSSIRTTTSMSMKSTTSDMMTLSSSHPLQDDETTTSVDLVDHHHPHVHRGAYHKGHHHHHHRPKSPPQGQERLNDLQRNDMKQLSLVFGDFLSIFCKPERPLIWVLDDLQWADAASLELLESILSNPKIGPMLFCGLYRSNTTTACPDEQEEEAIEMALGESKEELASFVVRNRPPALMRSLLASRGHTAVTQLSVSNLCVEDVSDFIAETLDLSNEQVAPLTEVIYSKTLGNVFFCKQALEELARKNVIYYDLMLFQWQFNVDKNTALHSVLSDDVIQMVQSKLQTLPQGLQDGLMVAAYIGHTFDLKIIHSCLKSLKTKAPNRKANRDDREKNTAFLSSRQLREYLELAVSEGLLVRKKGCIDEYKFAHDRIQEASYRLPLKNETNENREEIRGRWLVRLSQKLIGLVTVGNADKEWMLFVAVQHLNKVPPELVPDPVYLAKLNLRVATLCVTKASYLQAVELLRTAVQNLERSSRRRSLWREQYDFLLKLYNEQLQTEFGVGNLKEAEIAINEVLNNARFLKDKCLAQYTKVQLTVQQSNRNYALGAQESAKVLKEIGIYIPAHPTRADILKERCKLQIAFGTRSLSSLIDLPQMQEDWIMKLLSQLALLAAESKNVALSTFIHLRSARLSLEHGSSKYLPLILSCYCTMLRERERYHTAYDYASIIAEIYLRSPQFVNDWEYVTCQVFLYSGVIHLKEAFANSIDIILSNYRQALTLGNINYAFAAAMHFPLFYFAGGLPFNALLEPKLILLEDKSKQLKQPSFLTIFQACRQVLYNLQGKVGNENLTQLKGQAMNEDVVLSEMGGNRKRMAYRDICTFRLMLAFVFGDEETMEAMITRLEPYPYFDLALVREHLRCTFHGLAALQLARSKKSKKHLAMGRVIVSRFKKLDRIGSENAAPVLKCLQAMMRHKKSAYDKAIEACKQYNLMHFEAMMREHCGRLLIGKNRDIEAKIYLGEAMWQYHDWGAQAKVKQLQKAFPFMARYRRREASRASMTARVSLFGVESTMSDDGKRRIFG